MPRVQSPRELPEPVTHRAVLVDALAVVGGGQRAEGLVFDDRTAELAAVAQGLVAEDLVEDLQLHW